MKNLKAIRTYKNVCKRETATTTTWLEWPLVRDKCRLQTCSLNTLAFPNGPFSKTVATDLNEWKLKWMKNWWQHWKEHLNFSNPVKFQHIRCYISLGNVRWNLTNLQTFLWLGVYVIPPSHTNVCKFFIFQLTFSQLILNLICRNFAGLLK